MSHYEPASAHHCYSTDGSMESRLIQGVWWILYLVKDFARLVMISLALMFLFTFYFLLIWI